MITDYHLSKLWEVFSKKSSVKNQGKIETILDKTIPILKHIVRTFPTYTNHDEKHSLKIIENYEMLLGEQIENLSQAEACVLLLSAFWHDLGMVCNDINEVYEEHWYEEYKKNIPENERSNPSENRIAEYIRWNHHNRLEKYLYDNDVILSTEEKALTINAFNIIDISYQVSLTHNMDTDKIIDLKHFNDSDNDFIFCAILLRLADIIDFDNDRAPDSIYKFLGLDEPKNDAEEYSQYEWKKHLDNSPFEYRNSVLYFKAAPKDPDTEHAIRTFITVINHEIDASNKVFNLYCKKWHDLLKLPENIDLSGIRPIGYKYGEYKFTFDSHETLTLLSGNNIYSGKATFIRELLQNAIDASLYREALERKKGIINFKCKPINIIDWYDNNGNYWIRFDDYGTGMDEYILLNYFTKIGKSFYESKDFDSQSGFKAISRFGIGILSCFMASSHIEVSTKKEQSEAIRFTIKSLDSYFFTQFESEHRNVDAFPSPNDEKQKYRNDIGTSIAIMIDYNKINAWIEIQSELEEHIFYSPVEIQYKSKKIGNTLDELNSNPWFDQTTTVEFTEKDQEKIKFTLGIDEDYTERLKLQITPINLSNYSLTPKIKAQMVLLEIIGTPNAVDYTIGFDFPSGRRYPEVFEMTIHDQLNQQKLTINLNNYESLNIFKKINTSTVAHNGIIAAKEYSRSFQSNLVSSFYKMKYALAYICLHDEYRPSLDISRSKEIYFDFNTIITSNLLLSRFIASEKNLIADTFDCSLLRNRYDYSLTIKEAWNNTLLEEWLDQPLFKITRNDYISLNEIKKLITKDKEVNIFNYPDINHLYSDSLYKSHTRKLFVLILIQCFTDGYLTSEGTYIVTKTYENKKELNNHIHFPIGFFVQYDKEINEQLQLFVNHYFKTFGLNSEHPFSKWLYENSKILTEKYKGLFKDIINQFIHGNLYGEKNFEKLLELLYLLQKLNPNLIDTVIINSIKQ